MRRHGGELVLLWHNYSLAVTYEGYHRRLYPRILDYLARLWSHRTRSCIRKRAP